MSTANPVAPCDFVVFGGTGDLAVRKLLPALYLRDRDGQLPAETRVIAASRAGLDVRGYRDKVRAELGRFVPEDAVDQQTLEARAYAVARRFKPLLVNSVVGFIGPEYLFDGKQITRAGIEDHFCGKLMGVPMGVDVCYTNHAEADQDDADALLALLVASGVNFVMGVPGADDIMLGYQSTSFHDALAMRDLLGRRPAPEFETWLERQGLMDAANRIRPRTMPGRFRALLPA